MKSKIVVLSGAGISQESGINTFRDSDGLWENHRVEDVATPEGFMANPELVFNFYNERRRKAKEAKPNKAHLFFAELEKDFDVEIITQNVDDLHERAGSSKVVHLHGELNKARSSKDPKIVFPIDGDMKWGDKAPNGDSARPHIVWFGEAVPELEKAIDITKKADVFIVIGTSMQVYPAASLVDFLKPTAKLFVIDPNDIHLYSQVNFIHIKKKATQGVEELRALLSKD
ncbi:NAD-dependent deacylase [Weeksellaceae bacterium TAE3-ERU29]|nr:NAD-dependent deacylase [Weeksellaceae bacterium TAE3-ERU29]